MEKFIEDALQIAQEDQTTKIKRPPVTTNWSCKIQQIITTIHSVTLNKLILDARGPTGIVRLLKLQRSNSTNILGKHPSESLDAGKFIFETDLYEALVCGFQDQITDLR